MNADALIQAAETGDIETVRSLLNETSDVAGNKELNEMALIRAASNGHLKVLQLLLDKGANVNARRSDGMTPLIRAAFFGQLHTVQTLLANGADINATDRLGLTASDWALSKGHSKVLQVLTSALNGTINNRLFNIPEEDVRPIAESAPTSLSQSANLSVDNAEDKRASNTEKSNQISSSDTTTDQFLFANLTNEEADFEILSIEADEPELEIEAIVYNEQTEPEPSHSIEVKESLESHLDQPSEVTQVAESEPEPIALTSTLLEAQMDQPEVEEPLKVSTISIEPPLIEVSADRPTPTFEEIREAEEVREHPLTRPVPFPIPVMKRAAAIALGVVLCSITIIYFLSSSGKETVVEANATEKKVTTISSQTIKAEPNASIPLLWNYPKRRPTTETSATTSKKTGTQTKKAETKTTQVAKDSTIKIEQPPKMEANADPVLIESSNEAPSPASTSGKNSATSEAELKAITP
jgi:hypothetical protein